MSDVAPLLPNEAGLQPGGTFPTQVRIMDGSESMANITLMEDTGNLMLSLAENMVTASNILLSYMDMRTIQLLILNYSVKKQGFEVEADNLFTSDSYNFSSENPLWLEVAMKNTPIMFIKNAKQASMNNPNQEEVSEPMQGAQEQRQMPVFTPSNKPVIR